MQCKFLFSFSLACPLIGDWTHNCLYWSHTSIFWKLKRNLIFWWYHFQPTWQPISVREGSEPDIFWNALGGKTEYPREKEIRRHIEDPHLFTFTFIDGRQNTLSFKFHSQKMMCPPWFWIIPVVRCCQNISNGGFLCSCCLVGFYFRWLQGTLKYSTTVPPTGMQLIIGSPLLYVLLALRKMAQSA